MSPIHFSISAPLQQTSLDVSNCKGRQNNTKPNIKCWPGSKVEELKRRETETDKSAHLFPFSVIFVNLTAHLHKYSKIK